MENIDCMECVVSLEVQNCAGSCASRYSDMFPTHHRHATNYALTESSSAIAMVIAPYYPVRQPETPFQTSSHRRSKCPETINRDSSAVKCAPILYKSRTRAEVVFSYPSMLGEGEAAEGFDALIRNNTYARRHARTDSHKIIQEVLWFLYSGCLQSVFETFILGCLQPVCQWLRRDQKNHCPCRLALAHPFSQRQ